MPSRLIGKLLPKVTHINNSFINVSSEELSSRMKNKRYELSHNKKGKQKQRTSLQLVHFLEVDGVEIY